MTVRLTVHPRAAARPALKYQLLPEVGEMNAGNAAQWYLRCFAEQRTFFFSKAAREERTRLLTMPLAELPVRDNQNYGGHALRQADWAARLDSVDWQVLPRIQNEGLELTQSELEPLLALAQSLRVRLRLEIAAGKFDDAIGTAKTLFAFARHLGESPTEKANRLGLTVADLTLDTLEELIQQPRSPNLYWALTELPGPLVEIRKGLQAHVGVVSKELKSVRDDACMSNEEAETLVSRLSGIMSAAREEAGLAPRSFRAALASRVSDAEKLRALRQRLIRDGAPEGLVPNFPPFQAVLLEEKRLYEDQCDDRMKLVAFAPWQLEKLIDVRKPGTGLLAVLLPPVVEMRVLQARCEQRIAFLRYVEAIRMYAAGHTGALPPELTDLTVPLPVDPFTGKPFAYESSGTSARLRGGSLSGNARTSLYEIVIRR